MLGRIGNKPLMPYEAPRQLHNEDKYQRNEIEDMKKGIEYLYEFREKLFNLHPIVFDAIEKMLQH